MACLPQAGVIQFGVACSQQSVCASVDFSFNSTAVGKAVFHTYMYFFHKASKILNKTFKMMFGSVQTKSVVKPGDRTLMIQSSFSRIPICFSSPQSQPCEVARRRLYLPVIGFVLLGDPILSVSDENFFFPRQAA